MNDNFEKLGQLIDSIEDLTYMLNSPLPPKMHVDSLRTILPTQVKELKEVFIRITGENPWE